MSRGVGTVGIPVSSVPFVPQASAGLRLLERSAATTITASATPHAKGAWTELIAATADHAGWVELWISTTMASAATDTRGLLDLGIGAAASEVAIVTEIPVGFINAGMSIRLPVWVPKGARLSARLQSLIASDTVALAAYLHTNGLTRHSPSKLVTLNADTAASTSTTMMTASNTWTEVAAATTQAFSGLVAVMCGGASAAWSSDTAEVLSVGVGASGAEVLGGISPTVTWTNGEVISIVSTAAFATGIYATSTTPVPNGSRVAVKITTGRPYKGAIVFGVPA